MHQTWRSWDGWQSDSHREPDVQTVTRYKMYILVHTKTYGAQVSSYMHIANACVSILEIPLLVNKPMCMSSNVPHGGYSWCDITNRSLSLSVCIQSARTEVNIFTPSCQLLTHKCTKPMTTDPIITQSVHIWSLVDSNAVDF